MNTFKKKRFIGEKGRTFATLSRPNPNFALDTCMLITPTVSQ